MNKTIDIVKDFGAVGDDGVTDDTNAIRTAVAYAKQSGVSTTLTGFAGKTFRISKTVTIDFSNVRIRGEDGTILVADMPNGFIPFLFQNGYVDPQPIDNIQVTDLTIKYEKRGPDSAGAFQFNAVRNFRIARCAVVGDGEGQGNSKPNGFVFAFGSQDGELVDSRTTRLAKGGIYIADGENIDIINCDVSYGKPSTNPVATGYSIGYAKDCLIFGCKARNNIGNGIHIGGTAPFPCVIVKSDTSTSFDITSNIPLGTRVITGLGFRGPDGFYETLMVKSVTKINTLTWHIELDRVPFNNISVGSVIMSGFRQTKNVVIGNCQLLDNTEDQVYIGSITPGEIPHRVALNNCGIRGGNRGVVINAGNDIKINNCDVTGAKWVGIAATDVSPGQGVENVTNRLTINGGEMSGNGSSRGHAQVMLMSVNDVIMNGNRIGGSAEAYGIYITKRSVVTQNKPCTMIDIINPMFRGIPAGNEVVRT